MQVLIMTRTRWPAMLALLLGVLVPVAGVQAASVTWGGGTGDWFVDGNWVGGARPAAGDDAWVLGGEVSLTNDTPALGTLAVSGGTLVCSNWSTRIVASNVWVLSGTLTHSPNSATTTNVLGEWPTDARVQLECTNLYVATGASIDVSGKGFAGGPQSGANDGYGPGAGKADNTGPGGAGHGGVGGTGYTGGHAGGTYGLTNAPVMPGSGGGSQNGTVGGSGGGAVRVDAKGTVTINGTITADATLGPVGDRRGGGSGGSVYIACGMFAGTNGFITADGSSGGSWSGRGGGGRIAVDAAQVTMPKPSVRFSAMRGVSGHPTPAADIGTVHLADAQVLDGDCVPHTGVLYVQGLTEWTPGSFFMSNGWLRTTFGLNVTNDVTLYGSSGRLDLLKDLRAGGGLTMTNGADMYVYSDATNGVAPAYGRLVSVTGDVVIASGSVLYPVSEGTNGGSARLEMNDLEIRAGGSIDADGHGFDGGNYAIGHGDGWGPGGGYDAAWTGSGGSYGGRGTRSHDMAATRPPYGSASAPTLPGSGGATRNGGYGGDGGGLVWIAALGDVTVDGTITADGANAGHGGGSGGGVYITCNTLKGDGRIQADGESRGYTGQRANGGGGGGRIAVVYDTVAQSGVAPAPALTFSVRGGTGGNGTIAAYPRAYAGGLGTLYFPDAYFVSSTMRHSGRFVIPGFTTWSPAYIELRDAAVCFEQDGFQLTVAGDVTGTTTQVGLDVYSNSTVSIGGKFIGSSRIAGGGKLSTGGDWLMTNVPPYYSSLGENGEIRVGGSLVLADELGTFANTRLEVQAGPTNGATIEHGAIVDVSLDGYVGSNVWIYSAGDAVNGGQPFYSFQNLTLADTGGIKADGTGFAGGYGPGAGGSREGGSYGGNGGPLPHVPDATYGSSNAPTQCGSGAGYYGGPGGPGGGLVRIEVDRDLTINGTITADGMIGSGSHTSGGSGGGIYLRCKSFTGAGTALLSADGSNGRGAGGYAMGGGGGRIAVWRIPAQSSFLGSVTVAGGDGMPIGPDNYDGEPGTIYWGIVRPAGSLFMVR